jgi:hypothetical protein
VGETGKPGQVNKNLPVIARKATGKLSIFAHENADPSHNLQVAQAQNALWMFSIISAFRQVLLLEEGFTGL